MTAHEHRSAIGVYHPTVKPLRVLRYECEDIAGEIPTFVMAVNAPDVVSGLKAVERELSIAEIDRERMLIIYRYRDGDLPL